jgi:hypothetical protein
MHRKEDGTVQRNWHLVPTIIVPNKRHVVCNLERTIFVEEGEFTTASGASGEPENNRTLSVPSSVLEEEIEHPVQ